MYDKTLGDSVPPETATSQPVPANKFTEPSHKQSPGETTPFTYPFASPGDSVDSGGLDTDSPGDVNKQLP